MRRKSKKSKHEENETPVSEPAENSDIDNANEENEGDDNSDTSEPETKKRKSDKKVSFTSKKSSKDKKDREAKENSESTDVDNGDAQYEVESVMDAKTVKGVKHYLIRWKGFTEEHDTWEPESVLNCPEIIKQYEQSRKGTETSKSRKSKDLKKKSPKKSKDRKKSHSKDDDEEKWDENEEFEVDRIVEVHHKRDGKREFLVSWKGYPQTQNSWVEEDDMTCNDLIAKFMAKVERARETEQKDLRVKPAHTDRFTLSTAEHGRRLSKRNFGKQRVQYHDAE